MTYNLWYFSSEKRNFTYLFGLIMNQFFFKDTHKKRVCQLLPQVPPQKTFGFPSITIMTNIKMQ